MKGSDKQHSRQARTCACQHPRWTCQQRHLQHATAGNPRDMSAMAHRISEPPSRNQEPPSRNHKTNSPPALWHALPPPSHSLPTPSTQPHMLKTPLLSLLSSLLLCTLGCSGRGTRAVPGVPFPFAASTRWRWRLAWQPSATRGLPLHLEVLCQLGLRASRNVLGFTEIFLSVTRECTGSGFLHCICNRP